MEQKIDLAKSMSEYAGRIKLNVPKIAELYRKNEITEVTDMMLDLIEGIEWMISALFILEDDLNFDNDEIVDILPQIQQSLENTDYNLLADILEYEIIPISDKIGNECNKYVSNSMN